jgi:hypothetical protein
VTVTDHTEVKPRRFRWECGECMQHGDWRDKEQRARNDYWREHHGCPITDKVQIFGEDEP